MWFGLPSLACATTTLEKLSCSEREIVLYLKMQIYYSNCHIRSTLSSSYILHTRNNIVFSVKLHVNFLQIIMANFKNLGGKKSNYILCKRCIYIVPFRFNTKLNLLFVADFTNVLYIIIFMFFQFCAISRIFWSFFHFVLFSRIFIFLGLRW